MRRLRAILLATLWLPLVAGAGEVRPPRLVSVKPSAARVARFGLFELTVDLDAEYTNPYDPDDIAVTATFVDSTGRAVTVNGFLHQDYGRKLTSGAEQLTPRGKPTWKVRYAPTALGPHRYAVRVRTRGGQASDGSGAFTCEPSKDAGFIRVSRANPRYFEFSTGRPFFPIGHNICWVDSKLKTYDYENYYRKMAAASENFTRIWMCSWSLELEGKALDDYRLDNAWRLDHILRFARQYGIYAKLCFDNFYDFTQKRHGPYWKSHGGVCDQARCFFTKAQAREHYKRRLRYIVARWGHSPQVMSWEFWNEMDYAPSEKGKVLSKKEPYMLAWTAEMAAELRRLDPYGHCVTNTLAAYTDWPEFWASPTLDFVQIHAYIYDDWVPNPHQWDAAALVLDLAQDFEQFRKPLFIAEFGFHAPKGDDSLIKQDVLGIHLHNALWASCLGGAAGAPMLWWWDNYVEPNDLYYHYRAVGRFLAGVDWTGVPWVPLRDGGKSALRLVGIRSGTHALLWFQDRRNTWDRRVQKKEPARLLDRFALRIPGIQRGAYRVEWFDTYNGHAIVTSPAQADAAGLLLELSHLVKAPDVACKIRPAGEDPTSITFPASSAARFQPERLERTRIHVR